jgi:cobalt/nickel transport system ATP-binding protein
MEPHVLILDEPFAGLDPAMSAEVMTILDDLHRGGTSLIIATHDLDLAYAWADDVIILHEGRLLAQGAAPDLLSQPTMHAELGAAPLVAELAGALALTGISVYDKGYLPRTGAELVRMLHNLSRQENKP